MSGALPIRAAQPADFNDTERAHFFELVVEGGEVGGAVLAGNIAAARALVVLIDGDTICGIAALKRPRASYREKTAAKSRLDLDATSLPYELGYVYVQPDYQGQGQSHRLIAAALEHTDGAAVFATVRTDNGRMRSAFEKAGFVSTGNLYPGRNGQPIGVMLRVAG